jgi:hypothetical protein
MSFLSCSLSPPAQLCFNVYETRCIKIIVHVAQSIEVWKFFNNVLTATLFLGDGGGGGGGGITSGSLYFTKVDWLGTKKSTFGASISGTLWQNPLNQKRRFFDCQMPQDQVHNIIDRLFAKIFLLKPPASQVGE